MTTVLENEVEEELELLGSWSGSSYTMMTVGTVGSVVRRGGPLPVSPLADEETTASTTPVSKLFKLSTTAASSSDFCSTVSAN